MFALFLSDKKNRVPSFKGRGGYFSSMNNAYRSLAEAR
jgi:hypothetical protein